ncbi:MAG: DUF2975 domain-containing protein [Cellulomonas sp.]|nr:DUF2975 domain-containing protein [Cellulomonas sp.]
MNGNPEVAVSLIWLVVMLLVLGGGIVGVLRFRPVGPWGTGVVLEGIALLVMVGVFVAEVVAPLARLANRTYVASHQEGRLTWQIDDLPVTLDEAGVAAVYAPGRTEAGEGWTRIPGVSLTDPQTTALAKFDHPGWVDFMATTGSTVLNGLVVVAAIFFLWRVARTIRSGNPFDPANTRRLYTVGVLFLVGAGLSWAGAFFTFVALGPLSDYVDWSVEMRLDLLVLGLVVVTVAEVFRRGVTLRQDTEGLV